MTNFFKRKWLKVIVVAVVIFLAAPTVALGGSFVVSLIQGKTAEEAVQILAEQIDSVIGRIEVLETRQTELENRQTEQGVKLSEQEQTEACRFAGSALITAQTQGGVIDADITTFEALIAAIIDRRDNSPQDQYQMWQSRLGTVQTLKEQYLVAKDKCEEN
jgi:ABC-type Na+ efflux pump permease subunit